jgi:hypothetical protein
MKRLIAAMILAAGIAAAQDANQMHYLTLVPPSDTAAITGAGVDVSAYKGNARLLADFEANTETGYVATVTFAHSANNADFATITNTAGAACVITKSGAFTNSVPDGLSIDSRRLKKYVRAVVAQTGETNAVSALIVFPMK